VHFHANLVSFRRMSAPLPPRDPTRAKDEYGGRDFTVDLAGPKGPRALAGVAWNDGGGAGRVGIVHGLGDHARRYGRAVHALVDRDFAVEALDLPGHGESYGPRGHAGSWEDYLGALDAWWSRPRAGDPPIALVGHSMGALVALDFTLRHPGRLRALVLSAPPFEVVLRATMLKVRLAQLVVRIWPGFSQQTTILPSMLSHDADVVRAHNVDPLVHYLMSARLFFEFRAANDRLRKSAGRIDVPTLVLHGGADPISSPAGSDQWVRSAPPGRVEYRRFPGLYHEILNEPEGTAIAADVADWIRLKTS
jgi:alpha-beta hydrolase superfamily lysophospholipase